MQTDTEVEWEKQVKLEKKTIPENVAIENSMRRPQAAKEKKMPSHIVSKARDIVCPT